MCFAFDVPLESFPALQDVVWPSFVEFSSFLDESDKEIISAATKMEVDLSPIVS